MSGAAGYSASSRHGHTERNAHTQGNLSECAGSRGRGRMAGVAGAEGRDGSHHQWSVCADKPVISALHRSVSAGIDAHEHSQTHA